MVTVVAQSPRAIVSGEELGFLVLK